MNILSIQTHANVGFTKSITSKKTSAKVEDIYYDVIAWIVTIEEEILRIAMLNLKVYKKLYIEWSVSITMFPLP